MRKFLSQLVRPLGYEVIRIRNSHTAETALKQAFELTQPKLVLDVGANNGQFYQLCRDIGYSGKICCFEPSPQQYKNLLNLQSNDSMAEVFQVGVGSKTDRLMLNVSGKLGDMSSFLEQNELYKTRFGKTTDRVEVDVITLENFLDEQAIGADIPFFVKTDTQGMDKHVLDGLGKYLNSDCLIGIKSEMSVQSIYDHSISHWKLLDLFRELEMEPLYFEHISRTDDYKLLEYDIIATK